MTALYIRKNPRPGTLADQREVDPNGMPIQPGEELMTREEFAAWVVEKNAPELAKDAEESALKEEAKGAESDVLLGVIRQMKDLDRRIKAVEAAVVIKP